MARKLCRAGKEGVASFLACSICKATFSFLEGYVASSIFFWIIAFNRTNQACDFPGYLPIFPSAILLGQTKTLQPESSPFYCFFNSSIFPVLLIAPVLFPLSHFHYSFLFSPVLTNTSTDSHLTAVELLCSPLSLPQCKSITLCKLLLSPNAGALNTASFLPAEKLKTVNFLIS